MSLKELILIPKQKLQSLTKTSAESKDVVDVETQTEDRSVNLDEKSDVKDEQKFVKHLIQDGVPGNMDTKHKRKRKTLKWKPY